MPVSVITIDGLQIDASKVQNLGPTVSALGVAGPQGPQGPQGIQGVPGADGALGAQGIQGIQGPQGLKGDTGATGPAGTTDYNLLLNKPTLGALAAKNAVDYSTTDVTNKPTIPSTFDNLLDGTTNKAYTATEKTKLAGIASGATVGADWNTNVANKPTLGTAAALNAAAASGVATLDASSLLVQAPTVANGAYAASDTPATTGTMTLNMGTVTCWRITPSGACTFNASGGVAGQSVSMIVTSSGTTARVLTFGTNFKAAGTLSTGTVTAKVFCISFVCKDGTLWVETGRTAAM